MKESSMKLATKRRPVLAAITAVLMLSFVCCNAVLAQVMEQVPADALAVLRIRDLKATSGKLGKFLTDLGVGAMVPGSNDPLNFLQTKANIKQGLNSAGDMAIV